MWYLLRKYASQVYLDPSSIGGIASLIHHPEVVDNILAHDHNAKQSTILQHLAGKRYRLGIYQAYNGSERYGIIPADNDELPQPTWSTQMSSGAPPGPQKRRTARTQIFLNAALLLTAIGLIILNAVYYTTLVYEDDSPLNFFLNTQVNGAWFRPRILFACAGIFIKSQWARLERRGVIFEPFRRLYNGTTEPAPAKSTVPAPRTLIPVSTLFATLRNGCFYNALLASTALLAEFLIIVLPSIPYASSKRTRVSEVSAYIALAILGFMLVVMVAVWLRKEVPLPKDPNTLGAMAMYVAGS